MFCYLDHNAQNDGLCSEVMFFFVFILNEWNITFISGKQLERKWLGRMAGVQSASLSHHRTEFDSRNQFSKFGQYKHLGYHKDKVKVLLKGTVNKYTVL